jgi:undecaprenyl diphosphate synthase
MFFSKSKKEASNGNPVGAPSVLPRHIAMIMDGNGRWAKKRLMPRIEGHRSGAKTVRMVVEQCRTLGIQYLTLYTFSTENWNRPADEVSMLMRLFEQHLLSERELFEKNDIRLRAIGDRSRLPEGVRNILTETEELTKNNSSLQLILAVSYGGREEIVQAARKLAERARVGEIKPEQISAADFQSALYAPDVPDPDVLIRTSDENRISNFLLWQLAYTEIVVTSHLWPEFSVDEFHRCLHEFAGRTRRFGLTSEQLAV